jgi:hypothetical protein
VGIERRNGIMIILKSVLENYITAKRIGDEPKRILKFWSNIFGYIQSTKSLLEQIFMYDLIWNLPRLNFNYPSKVYESNGYGYLRPEVPDGAEIHLTYFKNAKVSLYESYLYRENNIDIAMMDFAINNCKLPDGRLKFKNNIFAGTEDFSLDRILDYIDIKIENFNLIKFSDFMFNNWSCFKDCIFVDSWLEFPKDWDNYPKNKIILMLNNMLKTE